MIEAAFEPRAQNRSNCTAHSEVFQFRIAATQLMGDMPLVKTTFIKGSSVVTGFVFFPHPPGHSSFDLVEMKDMSFQAVSSQKSRPTKCKKEHQIWPFKCIQNSFSGGEVVNS